jgi:hypothetical protein
MWSRIHLIPLLTAEEDRDQVRRYYAQQSLEKELLGTDTKVYNSDRSVLAEIMSTIQEQCANIETDLYGRRILSCLRKSRNRYWIQENIARKLPM